MNIRSWIKGFICIYVIPFFILFCIFPPVSRTYEFPNSTDHIVSIELMVNSNEVGEAEEDKLITQKSLSMDEIESFMDEIYKLETRRRYPPMWGWGDYVARVTYDNGDVELLGSGNIEYVESGSLATGDGPYVFWGYGIFEEVFLRYLE